MDCHFLGDHLIVLLAPKDPPILDVPEGSQCSHCPSPGGEAAPGTGNENGNAAYQPESERITFLWTVASGHRALWTQDREDKYGNILEGRSRSGNVPVRTAL